MTSVGKETIDRTEALEWVFRIALINSAGYRKMLQNKEVLKCVYPEKFITSDNPKIMHTIEGSDYIFTTTKNEIVKEHNFKMFLSRLIALSIVGLTAVFEQYLKEILKNHFHKNVDKGVFYHFKNEFNEKTKRDIENDFEKYPRLLLYYNVRHIIVHSSGRIDSKFKKNIKTDQEVGDSYVFHAVDVPEYNETIKDFVNFVDSYLG
ncbi:hypothetical protein C5S36_09940 [Candidatus Methanophagaceae archaeon]|nr:hypothetical protein C5S39_07295 [Methanophagales archaeon]KAF5431737.1 hypothetical protein C5S36_09940 [Methanophagales archaeon]